MIGLDLCQPHCQALLKTRLRFTKENVNYTKKEKKTMSEYRLIRLKNNELYCKCKECNDESYESINGLNKRFPNTYRFCNEDVNNFFFVIKKRCLSL